MKSTQHKTTYEIYLPDNKKIRIWFMGKQLEELLKAYNIKYKVISHENR